MEARCGGGAGLSGPLLFLGVRDPKQRIYAYCSGVNHSTLGIITPHSGVIYGFRNKQAMWGDHLRRHGFGGTFLTLHPGDLAEMKMMEVNKCTHRNLTHSQAYIGIFNMLKKRHCSCSEPRHSCCSGTRNCLCCS